MREIMFRAMSINGSDWVFGDLRLEDKLPLIYTEEGDCYEVYPETVGQFTGIRDGKDLPIYEGDVIRYVFDDGSFEDGAVFYEETQCRFAVSWKETNGFFISELAYDDGKKEIRHEIVGNVHEWKDWYRRTHRLKIQQEFAEAILRGKKMFEIRKNDRDYLVGDIVIFDKVLDEVKDDCYPNHGICKKRYEITYITDYEQTTGFVVFGIKEVYK